jgi:polysaccharide export outer membrane protein
MKRVFAHAIHSSWLASIAVMFLTACSSTSHDAMQLDQTSSSVDSYDYLIGPGDDLGVFVWRHPEVSQEVTVRPDGRITTPLVEDLNATGKTSSQLARDIEKVLETYIRQPIVTVTVKKFIGPYYQQVRVVGQATTPQALPYSRGMSLLDVMIAVGGLTEFAAGNRASIVRFVGTEQKILSVRIEDLLQDGEISANVPVLPGDVLVIPESWL